MGRGRVRPLHSPAYMHRGGPIHTVALAPVALSARLARQITEESTAETDPEVRDVVLLLVSELVTNAVLHGGPHAPHSMLGLTLDVRADRIRVEVEDAGSSLPMLGDGDLDRVTGRGLLLVNRLSTKWGCTPSEFGKIVWFEMVVFGAAGPVGVGDGDGDG